MTKVNVAEATNIQLDWLVAKCLGETEEETLDILTWLHTAKPTGCWNFCTDWSQMGPIIERERINLEYDHDWEYDIEDPDDNGERWQAIYYGQYHHYGSTPLVAACRCYVESKLGEVVEVPKELT